MDNEDLADKMAELIYDRSRMARGDADDLAWDLLRMVEAELKAAQGENERLRGQKRIETVEQLKQLQPRPDLINGVLIRAMGVPSFGGVLELNDDGTWNDFDSQQPGGDRTAPEDVPLPAYVLWEPEAK